MGIYSDQLQEFLAGAGILFEGSFHVTGDDASTLLFYAAHDHAEVRGFDDDADAAGLQKGIESVTDLLSESFLYLESTRIHIDDARDLTQSDHMFGGEIPYMNLANEGEKVMLTERIEFDIFNDDHSLRVGTEEGRIGFDASDIELRPVARGHLAPGFEEASGSILEPFTGGILSEFLEEANDEVLMFFTCLFLAFPGEFHPLRCRDIEDAVTVLSFPIKCVDVLFVSLFVELHRAAGVEDIIDKAVSLFRRIDDSKMFWFMTREFGSDDRATFGDSEDP